MAGDRGPQFVCTIPSEVRQVPHKEREAEAIEGIAAENSHSRRRELCEYATIAKSWVRSTPVTRTGLGLLS